LNFGLSCPKVYGKTVFPYLILAPVPRVKAALIENPFGIFEGFQYFPNVFLGWTGARELNPLITAVNVVSITGSKLWEPEADPLVPQFVASEPFEIVKAFLDGLLNFLCGLHRSAYLIGVAKSGVARVYPSCVSWRTSPTISTP
jgi:hypothetical protein